jgi:hypothetical protein
LLDKTEARYAEIARIMWDTNQWIMPQIDYGIPFWAKPPLSTWLSAGSYFLLGLMSLHQATLLFYSIFIDPHWKNGKKERAIFLLTWFYFINHARILIHTGVVSTDTALSFINHHDDAFWKTMNDNKKVLELHLLCGSWFRFASKGSFNNGVTFPPLFIWCCLEPVRFKTIFQNLIYLSVF